MIAEFRDLIGAPTAEALRVLATELRLNNITALQCVNGFRFLNQLNNCGISPEKIMPFVVGIHEKCFSSNLAADQMFEVCQQILELNESVSISHLPQLISEQVKRKQDLETDLHNIKGKIEKLRNEDSEMFEQLTMTRYDLDEFKQIEKKFRNYGLVLHEDTKRILNFLENLEKYGGDINEFVKILGDVKNCNDYFRSLQRKVSDLKSYLKRKSNELKLMERKLSSGNQLLLQYKELEKLGIGISDLKSIRNIVVEISSANFLSPEVAIRRFAIDILTNYEPMMGIAGRTREIKKYYLLPNKNTFI